MKKPKKVKALVEPTERVTQAVTEETPTEKPENVKQDEPMKEKEEPTNANDEPMDDDKNPEEEDANKEEEDNNEESEVSQKKHVMFDTDNYQSCL